MLLWGSQVRSFMVFFIGVLLIITPSILQIYDTPTQVTAKSTSNRIISDFIDSDPIVIRGDSDFETMNFPGEGTESSPYLIKGLRISSEGVCIAISRTSLRFVIRNCLLIAFNDSHGRSIDLFKVSNALLENVTVQNRATGIDIVNSKNILISNCSISASFLDDLKIWDSNNITVENTKLTGHPSRIGSSNEIHKIC